MLTHPTYGEVRLEPREGGVTLSVSESGFSQLGRAREDWIKHREGNDTGRRDELTAAKAYVEAS